MTWLHRERRYPFRLPIGVIGPGEATAAQLSHDAGEDLGVLQLLLAQQEQSEVGPPGGLLRYERDHAVELLSRQHLLRRLHGRQAGVEGRHRLAVRLRRDLGLPP